MCHSLRFPARLLAVIGATVTMLLLAATTASALVPPPDPAGSGTRHPLPAPGVDPVASSMGLALVAIIATAVVALAVAGLLVHRAGRSGGIRHARPAASTTR